MRLKYVIAVIIFGTGINIAQNGRDYQNQDSTLSEFEINDELKNKFSKYIYLVSTANKLEAEENDTIVIKYELYTLLNLKKHREIEILKIPVHEGLTLLHSNTYWKVDYVIDYSKNEKIRKGLVREDYFTPKSKGEFSITSLRLRLPVKYLPQGKELDDEVIYVFESDEIKIIVK